MSKSAILSSSIAKKYWMALTGLFLCLFLVGHLLGNLQLIFIGGEEGRRAFNEYAYFMTHNPLIKVMSYLTYLSILFHSIDGILLAIQNKKARPIAYAHNNPGANSKLPARHMALLGSAILLFIVIHMANFWWEMKYSSDTMPLHTYVEIVNVPVGQDPMTGQAIKKDIELTYALTTKGEVMELSYKNPETGAVEQIINIKEGTKFFDKTTDIQVAEGYKDLHSEVMSFFGQTKNGFDTNKYALFAVLVYVLSMIILALHLSHGFQSAFQSLGINHKKYTKGIKLFGSVFSILIPLGFAIIPIILFLNK